MLLGWNARETLGRDLGELVEWPREQPLSLGETLGMGRWQGECAVRHRDGHPVPVFVSHVRTAGIGGGRVVWLLAPASTGTCSPTPLPGRAVSRRSCPGSGRCGRSCPPRETRAGCSAGSPRSCEGWPAATPATSCSPGGHRAPQGRGDLGAGPRPAGDVLPEGPFARASARPFVVDDTRPARPRVGVHAYAGGPPSAGAESSPPAGTAGRAPRGTAGRTPGRTPRGGPDGPRRAVPEPRLRPLLAEDQALGFLVVTSARPGAFDDRVAAGLQRAAHHVATALERARLAEAERARRGG
nr:hypothetical protein GCM10020093_114550 [Planobispora longispora]